MEIKTKHIGAHGNTPASIIEVTFYNSNTSIAEDVTQPNKRVSKDFIQALRDLAKELEYHNGLVFEEENGISF